MKNIITLCMLMMVTMAYGQNPANKFSLIEFSRGQEVEFAPQCKKEYAIVLDKEVKKYSKIIQKRFARIVASSITSKKGNELKQDYSQLCGFEQELEKIEKEVAAMIQKVLSEYELADYTGEFPAAGKVINSGEILGQPNY